jgi:RNA polymerase sigma-70 factor (ECF subfamily)
LDPDQVAHALDGDRQSMQALVDRLLPIVQAEAGHALLRGGRGGAGDARQEVRDLVQEVFVALLAEGGNVLRSWDPARGMSLDNFVRLVAWRYVASTARNAASNEQLQRLLERLGERLDARGMLLFRLLYVDERSVEEVMQTTEMTRDAVYAWRSRFRKLLGTLASELETS